MSEITKSDQATLESPPTQHEQPRQPDAPLGIGLNDFVQQLLLSRKELKKLGIPHSGEHLRRLEAEGKFPQRIRLSPQRVAWDKAEILAWIDARAAERSQG